jgi:methylglyoxal synthase
MPDRPTLARHQRLAPGTMGRALASTLDLDMSRFPGGPLGGDRHAGAGIVEGRIDLPQSHDVAVKALLRLAVVHDIPMACNRASADFILSSPLLGHEHERLVTNIGGTRWHPQASSTT